MPAGPSEVLVVRLDRAADEVCRRLADPRAWEHWASGLGAGLTPRPDGRWQADGPDGPVLIRFSEPNPHGVLDHTVELPDGTAVAVPLRVVPDRDGCEVQLTLLRQPGVSDETWARDREWVARDLAALKAWIGSG